MEKKVSIIINCFNGEKYLKQTVDSILAQEYKNWELIFWDNKSIDNSSKILKTYNDERIKYFLATDHTSLYMARNLAAEKATGDFLAFLDCDDWWNTNFLSSRQVFFNSSEYHFSYSNCNHYFQKQDKYAKFTNKYLDSGLIFDFLAKEYLVKISCFIIRRDIFQKEIKFNKNYNIIGDFEYVMRIAEKYKAFAIQEPLANIRFHQSNFLDLNRKMFFEEYLNWFLSTDFSNENYKKNKKYFSRQLLKLRLIRYMPSFLVNILKKNR